jgi:hypothetical protein
LGGAVVASYQRLLLVLGTLILDAAMGRVQSTARVLDILIQDTLDAWRLHARCPARLHVRDGDLLHAQSARLHAWYVARLEDARLYIRSGGRLQMRYAVTGRAGGRLAYYDGAVVARRRQGGEIVEGRRLGGGVTEGRNGGRSRRDRGGGGGHRGHDAIVVEAEANGRNPNMIPCRII